MATDSPAGSRRSTGSRGWPIFVIVLLLSLVPEFFIHHHAVFGPEGRFGFYATYGLLSGVGVVMAAKGLAVFLRRPETYYDPD